MSLPSPLTVNQLVNLKDSLIQQTILDQHLMTLMIKATYRYVSFGVKSLFTRVPLNQTIKVILDQVYDQNVISVNVKKQTMK